MTGATSGVGSGFFRVLFVHADQGVRMTIDAMLRKRCGESVFIRLAATTDQAGAFLAEQPDIIVIEGCVDGESCACSFVEKVRGQGFEGPIIGVCILEEVREALTASGCSSTWDGREQHLLPDEIIRLAGVSLRPAA